MASTPENRPAQTAVKQDWFNDVVERVCNAGMQAFIIVLLGNVAVNIVGSVMGRMVPSPPPGLETASSATGVLHIWWKAVVSIKFYLLFAVLLYLSLREKYFAPADPAASATPSRWRRIGQHFSENWFGSMVGNAFIAMALATALAAIPSLSAWQWAWQWLTGFVGSRFEIVTGGPEASGWMTQVKTWFAWYGDNQLRFNFWVIYLGAMCDDFGIPNFKSLARWLWRRWTKPKPIPANNQIASNQSRER